MTFILNPKNDHFYTDPCLGSIQILRSQVRVGGGQEPHDKHQNDYVLHQCFRKLFFEVDRTNSFFDKLQVVYITHYQHEISWS